MSGFRTRLGPATAIAAGLAAGLAALGPRARADDLAGPTVDTAACPAFRGDALARAAAAELASLDAAHRAAIADRTIVITCPDATTANLRLEPAPADGPLARSLDLGDVPRALRPRLIALAVGELAETAARLDEAAASAPAPAPVAPVPPPPPAVIEVAPAPPPLAPPAFTTTAPSMMTAIDRAPITRPRQRTLLDPHAPASLAIAPRLGVRAFTAAPIPFTTVDATVERDAYALGLFAATGATTDPIGTLRGWLVGARADVALACTDDRFALCARVRVDGGVAIVSSRATTMGVIATTAIAPYGAAGLELDASYPLGRVAIVVTADAAYAEGLIAHAADRAPLRLAGPTVAGAIGLRWRP